jgi:hypothetical protein
MCRTFRRLGILNPTRYIHPMQLPFGQSAARNPAEGLIALWEQAKTAVAHPAACACRGLRTASLDPRVIEDDILDYLHTRYQDGGQPRLAAIVEGRRAQLMSPSGCESFEEWLRRLGAMPQEDRDALIPDLQQVLESFATLDQSGFVCY